MLRLSDAKITVFLVCVVAVVAAKNQRMMTVGRNLKRDAPVGNHFATGNIHGGFGQQGHQQFQLQTLSHHGLDGLQGSHFVMPHYSFGAAGNQGHNFAGTSQFGQLAKILSTQGGNAGAHGGGFSGGAHVGGYGGGFGQSLGGGVKTAPVTFAAAPSTSYGTPSVGGHLGGLGNLGGYQGASFVGGHGFGGSLGGLQSLGNSHNLQGLSGFHNLGGAFGSSLKGADFGASLKGSDFGANSHLLLNQGASFGSHQLPVVHQSASAQTVPSYAMGIKGLGHYSTGGALGGSSIHSFGDLGTQATLGHGTIGSGGLTFDTNKYTIPTYTNGKTLATLALPSSNRHTSVSNIIDQMKNPFKPSVLLGTYADVGSSGDSHGYGTHQLKLTALPSYSHAPSVATYDANTAYNTINYSEGSQH